MIAYIAALSLLSFAVYYPMLRAPRLVLVAPAATFFDVPDTTFDTRGFA